MLAKKILAVVKKYMVNLYWSVLGSMAMSPKKICCNRFCRNWWRWWYKSPLEERSLWISACSRSTFPFKVCIQPLNLSGHYAFFTAGQIPHFQVPRNVNKSSSVIRWLVSQIGYFDTTTLFFTLSVFKPGVNYVLLCNILVYD